ncbi:hypothetical protein OHS33_13740 [Streptomyces sp. NBC_00536]|uniref:hypothetical protein n=1 Tax=Streptomyces sp. NBC_00536 TaxID=2975769 RepID=UPI002E80FAA7|nr:hypothetical protein [Streptomyces sp. NBC_00536]WUC79306.1 hypothetical protein OHS33_13740 [Streptomyces sp. NBC_00536]
MNLKRMAVVAAAAVVGPTVLMATPAMADEVKNTAVTTPDTDITKDDAAAPAPAADAKPAPAPVVPVTPPAPVVPVTPSAPVVPPVAKPAPAPAPGDEDEVAAPGPKLGLVGVPSSFKAGDPWTGFHVAVNNDGKAQKSYVLVLAVADEHSKLTAKDVQVQVLANGHWVNAEIVSEEGTPVALLTDDISLPKGATNLPVRVRFGANAPVGEILFAASGGSNTEPDMWSDTVIEYSKITRGTSGGGNTGGDHGNGNGNTGGNTNNPKPDGGTTTPVVDHNTGNTGTGNTGTGNTGSTNAGGQLAETGADAATSWAVGGAGVALAMGAALVAGTGRRRRPTA